MMQWNDAVYRQELNIKSYFKINIQTGQKIYFFLPVMLISQITIFMLGYNQ
jgi:hypothetical protein